MLAITILLDMFNIGNNCNMEPITKLPYCVFFAPRLRSAAWAILLGMLEMSEILGMLV